MTITMLLITAALALALCAIGLVRVSWVSTRQRELTRFEKGEPIWLNYADYDTMMLKFWVWDVEKFKLADPNTNKGEAK